MTANRKTCFERIAVNSPHRTTQTTTRRLEGECSVDSAAALVVEEPLEIRLNDEPFAVTMRTPGADFDLVRGLLFTEGVIENLNDILSLEYSGDHRLDEPQNSISVTLRRPLNETRRWQRNLLVGSSCGLCGKVAIEELMVSVPPLSASRMPDPRTLFGMADTLCAAQAVFHATGGLHAAGLFGQIGQMLFSAEDIGRHNAVDKMIGAGLLTGVLPATDELVLVVSGRASFEIVQKALMARIGTVAAVSAASSLAVELATRSNIILFGFLRGCSATQYSSPFE